MTSTLRRLAFVLIIISPGIAATIADANGKQSYQWAENKNAVGATFQFSGSCSVPPSNGTVNLVFSVQPKNAYKLSSQFGLLLDLRRIEGGEALTATPVSIKDDTRDYFEVSPEIHIQAIGFADSFKASFIVSAGVCRDDLCIPTSQDITVMMPKQCRPKPDD